MAFGHRSSKKVIHNLQEALDSEPPDLFSHPLADQVGLTEDLQFTNIVKCEHRTGRPSSFHLACWKVLQDWALEGSSLLSFWIPWTFGEYWSHPRVKQFKDAKFKKMQNSGPQPDLLK